MTIRQHVLAGLRIGIAAIGCGHGLANADDAGDTALWSALAEGGKVMLMRHAESEEASPEVSLTLDPDGDCSREQNLSDQGRAQAEALRRALQAHAIQVETVLSSELCRARQTATLAFGDYEPWNALNLPQVLPADESAWLIEDVRERIADYSGAANLALVTHRGTINTLTFQLTEPADIVVLEPGEAGDFAVLGTLTLH